MSDLENGGPKNLPAIAVGWDEERQVPILQFDTTHFKSWQMVLMVLTAAVAEAEFKLKNAWALNNLAQAQQAQQNEQIRRRILGG